MEPTGIQILFGKQESFYHSTLSKRSIVYKYNVKTAELFQNHQKMMKIIELCIFHLISDIISLCYHNEITQVIALLSTEIQHILMVIFEQ